MQSLLDDIINSVNVIADKTLTAVEKILFKIPAEHLVGNPKKRKAPEGGGDSAAAAKDAAKREIENGTHQLETLLNASIDKNFDILELYAMQHILTVKAADRPYMQLSHYRGLDFDAAATSGAATVKSVTNLRRRVHASQRLRVALETEHVRNEALLKKLRAAVGVKDRGAAKGASAAVKREDDDEGQGVNAKQEDVLGFLRDRGSLEEGGTVRPITTTTEFTLSQLQALRSLSSSLRTLIPEISTGEEADEEEDEEDGDGEKSWRRERAEYVESASRRYIETVGGVEMGPAGEVRDGEWQGEGRGPAREEVEGLERVIAVLGASGGGGNEKTAEEGAGQEDEEMEQS